ncbi:phosphatidylinositol 5-phosphate 4-kinase type-2 alpha isoform X5 [Macrotis lagotis]|uniref:phosphatidylinositol 5-phosphate 4-kinase type-2 alpha isoform X5 n=1 Tax=Macrotis lagotis TaxID=92651 RepID=UPI003D68978A
MNFICLENNFKNSLTRSAPLPNDSQARSGARFHTSYDKRYIIKTITSEDVAEMHNILKKYHQYIVECHGVTLLPQFLGMYRLNVDGVEIYVIVTRNVFSHRLSVYRKYDLKGSTVAREASDKEKAKELPTLKDNDFINDGQKIYIDDNNKKMFLEKLKKDVENSLTRSAPLPNDSQARSGARFHTSYDKRYIIKTITSEDVAEMHNILKKYHQYIVECHGVTLLPQFLGMYRLNVDGVEIYVIVTRNVFSHRLSVYRKYDLKGSTVAREASDKEKAKELPTLKDNDFINDGQKIYIDDNNKKMFLEKLKKDVEFLAQLKLMDYSLLVGIHDVERAEQEEVECEENDGEEEGESDGTHPIGTPPDSPGNTLNSSPPLAPGEFDPNIDVYGIKCHENAPRKEVYFMAIIDILTHYDAKKKAAHAAKTVKHGAGAEISTVNPEQYSKRFLDFIGHILT